MLSVHNQRPLINGGQRRISERSKWCLHMPCTAYVFSHLQAKGDDAHDVSYPHMLDKLLASLHPSLQIVYLHRAHISV